MDVILIAMGVLPAQASQMARVSKRAGQTLGFHEHPKIRTIVVVVCMVYVIMLVGMQGI